MTTELSIVIQSVTGRIKVSARKAPGLALLMEKAAPPDLSTGVKRKLADVLETASVVDAALGARDRTTGAALQPIRMQFAQGWAAFEGALDAAALVPPEVSGVGARAIALRAKLLPDGREFARQSALEAYTYGRRVLAHIADEGLKPEVDAVIGAHYRKTAEHVTDQLADVLGLGDTVRRTPSSTAVAEAMEPFLIAVSAYTRALAADVDERSEASRRRFLDAIAPIQELRSTHATDPNDDGEPGPKPETPSTPAAPVTEVTTAK